MQNIKRIDWIFLIVLILIALVGEVLFFNRQGDFMVDVGREFYLSKEVALGKVLYKDIFNIYGPLSYQINACLFKLFGFHTNVLVTFGNLCGLTVIGSFYVLFRQFLPSLYSLVLTFFVIVLGIFNDWVFSYAVAYSFAMVYGLIALILSLILLINFIRTKEKTFYLYISMFFAGALIVLKYDYLPLLLLFPYVFMTEKVDLKTILKGVGCFCIVPAVSVFPLFLSGLNYQDVLFNVELMKKVATAPSLKYFYGVMSVLPSFKSFLLTVFNFIFFSILFIFVYKILSKVKTQWVYFTVLLLSLVLLCFDVFLIRKMSFLCVLLLVLVLFLNKKITDKSYWLLIIVSLLLSIKMFLWTNLFTYGLYSFPFLLLSCIVLLRSYVFNNEYAFKHCVLIFLISMIFPLLLFRLCHRLNYNIKVETPYGVLRTHRQQSTVKLLVEYLQKTIKEGDSLIVLPEGHIINFLTNTKSDDFYSNFIPMYVEAFGEENIINHYKQSSPDYFILSTRDSTEYGYTYICKDYAQNLCDWIFNNYYVVAKIVGEPQYTILRKK